MKQYFEPYSELIVSTMVSYSNSLTTAQRRHYAALESLKLGYGGQSYISRILGLGRHTIAKGIYELAHPDEYPALAVGRHRKAGAGRKKKTGPDTIDLLHGLIERHKAGSPTQPDVYWICLKPSTLSELFVAEHGIKLSHGLIKRELRNLGYRYRKISKSLATGHHAQRDAQFQIIFNLVLVMSLKSPVLSMDCKKKERIGPICREGKSYTIGQKKAYDHDYSYLGNGTIVPQGIYDLQQNIGYMSIGNSSETADFIIDNLRWYWLNHGIHKYPDATNMLLLCDAGGGNSYRHHAFKKALQTLAAEIGLSIIVSHYPPYASKWNPIEHRLFCHVHAQMSGQMFESYEQVKQTIERTTTTTGLTVIVRLNIGEYKTGIKTTKDMVDESRISFNTTIPELNYRIYP